MPTPRELQEAIARRLLEGGEAAIPRGALGRLGRTALAALRGRRLFRGKGDPGDLNALAAAVGSIAELKGIAMKVGQIMSYIDVALPEELRAALSALQTSSPPMPFAKVEAILREDLGARAGELLPRIERSPIAAASIGQVHRGWLADGTKVAVKVRYPEIEEAIASDFRPAAIRTALASLIYPGARIDSMVAEARERFLLECDYLAEAESQARFGDLYRDHPTIQVPEVHRALCSRRVLTTGFVDGLSFEAYLANDPAEGERDRIGEALFEFYVGSLFRHGLYNGDPHPGNYLFLERGRVALLDHGCTRSFAPVFVAKLAELTRAVHSDRHEELERSFLSLGLVRAGKRYDFPTARGLVRAFYGPMLEDRVQTVRLEPRGMGALFESKRKLMKLSLPGEFLFLFRIRFGLMSVLARLGARANWYRLERGYSEHAPRLES